MNTPSPAPQRRRRNPENTQLPARRRNAVKKQSASPLGDLFEGSFLERIPAPVRIALIALCVAVFFTCAVAITRSYLREQEERRRLEAEAAERAQHPLEYADLIVPCAMAQDLDPALVAAIILCESAMTRRRRATWARAASCS